MRKSELIIYEKFCDGKQKSTELTGFKQYYKFLNGMECPTDFNRSKQFLYHIGRLHSLTLLMNDFGFDYYGKFHSSKNNCF
jgi:hypothetical protein